MKFSFLVLVNSHALDGIQEMFLARDHERTKSKKKKIKIRSFEKQKGLNSMSVTFINTRSHVLFNSRTIKEVRNAFPCFFFLFLCLIACRCFASMSREFTYLIVACERFVREL